MTDFDAKRESIIQQSREIINLSKKIIYALHRNDMGSASKYVKEIHLEQVAKTSGMNDVSVRKKVYESVVSEYERLISNTMVATKG